MSSALPATMHGVPSHLGLPLGKRKMVVTATIRTIDKCHSLISDTGINGNTPFGQFRS